jgi:hypothetical protein
MLTYITNLAVQYWGLAVVAGVAVIYVIGHRKASVAFAVAHIKTFMIAAEKRAEALVLTTGQAKLAWVIDKAYDLLPGVVRLVVSKPAFAALVQYEYDVAVSWAEKHVQLANVDLPA